MNFLEKKILNSTTTNYLIDIRNSNKVSLIADLSFGQLTFLATKNVWVTKYRDNYRKTFLRYLLPSKITKMTASNL